MNAILLLLTLPVALLLRLAAKAPEGYEDAAGFHFGRRPLSLR